MDRKSGEVIGASEEPERVAAGAVGSAPSRKVFHCFLSHNSKDKPAVRALAKRLEAEKLSVWLDEEQLRPGLSGQSMLEDGLRTARSILVLVGSEGFGPWQTEEVRAFLSVAVRDPNRPVIPVLLAGAPAELNLSIFLADRPWVDFRPRTTPGDAEAFRSLIWGITGTKPDARAQPPIQADAVLAEAPEPRGQRADVQSEQPSMAIRQDAIEGIGRALKLAPVVFRALLGLPLMAGASAEPEVARRLCAAHGDFLSALRAFGSGLEQAAAKLQNQAEDVASLRRHARDILGWMVVTAVLDGYDREDSQRVADAWLRGSAFHIPLGRSPCVEVLTACWRGNKAQFSTESKRFDYGLDDITPESFGEIGLEDPRRLDTTRAVDYVWHRVFQDVHGLQAPAGPLPPAKIAVLRSWLDCELEKKRRLRLVIDRYELDQAFALDTTLAAIHAAIPQIHLIVIDSGCDADPGVFVLPASDLAARIIGCLKTIEALAP